MENLQTNKFESKEEKLFWCKNQIENILRNSNSQMYPQEIRREIIGLSGVNIGLPVVYSCLMELEETKYITSDLCKDRNLYTFKIAENCPPAKSANSIESQILEIRRQVNLVAYKSYFDRIFFP